MANLDELAQAFEDLDKNIKILCNAWANIIEKAFKQLHHLSMGTRVSYKSKYTKITANNTTNIKMQTMLLGDNTNAKYEMKEMRR